MSSAMSSYLGGIFVLFIILSPLVIPTAVTIYDAVANLRQKFRRIDTASGLQLRPAV
ncbi:MULTISPECIES: hypothetical protein [Mycobacterium]|uniref:hypothetical protein n=1 Tax=Mycobacterium TaxID=1763 RepID=UPI00148343CC|nr:MULTISPECIES: hypothetical protein [Mycobacterium]